MGTKSISEALLSLATRNENRTEIARLRDISDAIETALSAGVSRVTILDTLHRQGFSMNLKTFDNAIYRIRKRNKETQELRSALPSKVHPQNEGNALSNKISHLVENEKMPLVGSHNPNDLTQIMSAPVDLDALSKHAKRKK